MRSLIAGIICACTLSVRPVSAAPIDNVGNAGQIVVSAEHLAGVFVTHDEQEASQTDPTGLTATAKTDVTTTNISVFGNEASGLTGFPRLALDVFVVQGFSVGGALMYWTGSADAKLEATVSGPGVGSQTVTSDQQVTERVFVIAPRIGYAYAFDETFALWPRAGISYGSVVREVESEDSDPNTGAPIRVTDTTTFKSTNLTLELLLVASPFSHFALFGGPYWDISLAGSEEFESDAPGSQTVDGDYAFSSYGFTIGILAYF